MRALPAARLLAWALGPAVAGLVVGLAWWLLAPTAPVRVLGAGADGVGGVVLAERPELDAAQDGTLLLLAVAAGVVTGVVVALRSGARPTSATLAAACGSLAGAVVAVWLGQALGPESLAAQGVSAVQDGSDGSLVSPLVLHAPGVVLVWPVVALAVASLGHLALARARPTS